MTKNNSFGASTIQVLPWLGLGLASLLFAGQVEVIGSPRFEVKVVGYEDRLEFLSTYRLRPGTANLENVSTLRDKPNSTRYVLSGMVLREKTDREEIRRRELKNFNLVGMPNAKWVSQSPDRKRLVVGFEDQLFDPMRNIVVIETINLKPLKEFNYSGSRYILDVEWSDDSYTVAILYTKERFSLAPLDILKLVSGHGVTLNTIAVEFFDVRSGAIFQMPIAKDVTYGTGIIGRLKG